MKLRQKSQKAKLISVITALLLLTFQGVVFSQTPGMIIEPATGSGSLVLDPNGDGYVSLSPNGFVSDDQTESEINFSSFIFPGLEPNSDLNNAPNCGFTDFVDKGNKDPGRKYLSPANNWIFRLRMGSVSPNAKSYSVLIDTDGLFGNTGAFADPNYSLNNPGFEIEIVLATKFGVFVYDVNTPNCTPVISYPGTTNYQKAMALTTDCNDPDYFLDFFVNYNDLISQFGITTSTLMRYAILDNTAANKSTICNPSSASDIAGVGNCTNLSTCLTTIVNYQGFCAPNQTLCLARTSCPTILGSITNSATTVSGSSSEANGTVIRLYKNSIFTASTTVTGGVWSFTGLTPLVSPDVISVTAEAAGAYESLSDCNTQTVTACGTPVAAPVVGSTSGKNFCGTGIVGYDIKVHYPDMSIFAASPATSAYLPVPSGGSWVWKCTGNTGGCNSGSGVDCISNGGYMVFQTDANGCRSYPAFACVNQGGGYSPLVSQTPTLVANSVVAGSSSVAVTVSLNALSIAQSGYVYLFLNGAYYGVSNLITASGTATVACPALPGCATLSAMFMQAPNTTGEHDCFSLSSTSVSIGGLPTATPQITGNYCTATSISSVTGISSEANGTSIQLYVNTVSTGTPVSVNNGTWSVTGLNIAPGSVIRATAQAPCKTVSALSPSIIVSSQSSTTSLAITTSPIYEQTTSVSGTGVNGNVIQLYIDGFPVGNTVTVSGGVWTVSGISAYELYPGGVVAVAATTGTGCPSPLVNGGVVQCLVPSNTLAVTPANIAICTNTGVATLTITGTQSQVVYQLFLANGTTSTGRSILGTGGNIALSSGTLSANTTLRVKAMKIPATCNAFLTNTVGVVFGAPSTTLGVSVSPTTICSGKEATITVANSQSGFNYLLRNNSNNAAVGSTVAGTGNAITFTTGAMSANTTFNILSSGTGINTCSSSLTALATLSVNATPTLSLVNNTGTSTLTCNTPSLSFSASGGATYTWSPSLGTAATATVTNPGTYSLITTAANGCTATNVFAVSQTTASPVLTLAATASSLCTGQSATLSVTGASSYTWMPGNLNTTSIVVSPSTTTIYTVTGADGICIGTATFSMLMSPCITVVNDFTNTIQNTPVSGNVATNDSGTNGATFSITGQPTGGTVTINPSTGQFTFTPSPTFTGVTTATYNLCNGSPVTCSAGVITVTVYPTLIANPDQIVTTPSVTTTGSLATNDGGVVPGPVYNVSVTPVSPSSGTITVNPSTGGYTFVPNPNFTGTTSTTYTICNTSVNPTVCSSASILIQVGNTPIAVADFTNTMINTVVTGSAGINDGGFIPTLNPSFTISQPLSGTGTVAINASTGVYSYTPATGFTGTTSCTYTLCNTLSPPCSTTTITFSVYPAIATNSDIVSTTPGVVRSGSLAINDLGILTSGTLTANYLFTITQPASSVGTFVINPANGQYTFTPNASYTGSTQTTYTVCNTSVNPSVCSSTTVIIYVYPVPVPANDFTTTVSGGIVSGSAGANDTGTTSAVFSLLNPPTGGTMTINPSTGVYSFTASSTFTGVTTATYNLCNGALTTCSTAVITITVHPLIVANPDVINANPTSSVTGNLLNNDAGITSTIGATYSVTVVQPPSATGTIVLNPSTGQYTFIPNPNYSGTVQTTYQVCNTAVNPQQCSTSTITINVFPGPVPANDFTTTVINTPVSGNVGTNDGGTSGGTFSITGQPNGGTVTLNPSTGQYTFTPSPTFTGVTTATYNLCNGVPVTCSTAVLSVTVYPAIATNSDIVSTTPGVVRSGSLAINDLGILTSGTLTANYLFTITQPASSVGTFVINPANGQYTFTPNASYTGSTQTTYTVCNTSVNPSVCSSTTVIIYVYPVPVPANDFTTTVSGGIVSGSAGANDTGTTSAVFSLLNPPTGGTMTINPSTGVYSFTASSTFTGVTTATYNLCNGALTTCSTAVITITVHPLIVANPDVINANPTSSVTGNLLNNDAGITSTIGATYSVTVVQPPSATGTIVLNPSTGQYTFIPNPNYSGTVQTTYQVCNTAVNPQQCSTSTITINVFPGPLPANDFTTTVINTPVSGNVGTNDLGTSGGTFSITGQPIGGTVTINPSTGQYTFTPSPTFTGVTTATYNLCNGAPVTCSTAVLSVTVYPALQANDDLAQTSSTATVNGSLLGNDLGIVPGGTYSVTNSPIPTGSGTLIVNPATGQYTFIPNPAYSGSITSTYTVCNLSVNPIICSTATLTIFVGDMPIAVDDAAVTIINTPVSGSAATNDSNLTNAVFTFGNPGSGTLTGNPATGQFTFTPAAGFTGTTSATYTLCNIVSPPCATATIMFTVYPALVAVNDQTVTNINTPVSGSLTANDLGLVSGGTYSVSVAAPSAGIGSINVNPVTGSYTFTPATGYTGTVVLTYTVCQTNPSQCSTASLTIVVGAKSAIGLGKVLSKTEYNKDGTLNQTYKIIVKNMGNQLLSDIAVSDNLTATYPSPTTFTVESIAAAGNGTAEIAVNSGFTGIASNTLLTLPVSSSLTVGRTDTIVFTVKVAPNGYTGTYNNTASVTAIGSTTLVSDGSANGLDPDTDGDGDPENNSGPTTFTFSIVKIGIAKAVSSVENAGNGCHNITFKFTIKNYGTGTIYNVAAYDNLDNTFGSSATYSVVSGPTSVKKLLVPNPNFTGSGSNINMIASSSSLAAGATDTLLLKIKYCVKGTGTFSNIAQAAASSMPNGGFTSSVVSTNGLDPDPDKDNNPNGQGENDPTVFVPAGDFFIPQGFSPNNDGVNDVLKIRGIENYPNNEFSIINRWGNVVYKKSGYDNTWDGTANTGVNYGTDLLPEGTYFYILDLGDGSKALKGYIYLNRSAR